METIESLTNKCADHFGVDPATITTLTGMASRFLERAYGGREEAARALEDEEGLAIPALMHAVETNKKLLIRSHMESDALAATVLPMLDD